MLSLLLAAADIDPVWGFIFFAICLICAVVAMVMARAFDITVVGLAAAGIGGMIVTWP